MNNLTTGKEVSKIILLCTIGISCSLPSTRTPASANRSGDAYRLHLNPAPGTSYSYDVSSDVEMKLEVNDVKQDIINKTEAGIQYAIGRDSAGNFLFGMTYNKISLYTKNGDKERRMDADASVGISISSSASSRTPWSNWVPKGPWIIKTTEP